VVATKRGDAVARLEREVAEFRARIASLEAQVAALTASPAPSHPRESVHKQRARSAELYLTQHPEAQRLKRDDLHRELIAHDRRLFGISARTLGVALLLVSSNILPRKRGPRPKIG
jgi:hypothetical protein